jgi:primosomal protein N' (replication factor Y)
MYIIRVTPLAILPNTVPQVLDYFWTASLPPGSIVTAMVGRRAVMGLVLESLGLEHAKLAVKKSSFGLKRLSSIVTDQPQATSEQLALARWMSRQYFVPLGVCLKTVLPNWLGKRGKILQLPEIKTKDSRLKTSPRLILTQPDTALAEIRSAIAGATGQVLVVVPEVSLAEWLARELQAHTPLLVHSELTATAHARAYRTIMNGTPGLVIGTRIALFLPFNSLEHVIMEDPQHEAYKSDMTPRSTAPDIARELAQLHGAVLTYMSPALSTANHYLVSKKIFELTDSKPHWPEVIHVDMTQERQSDNRSLLSRHVQNALLDAYEDRTPILFFSPRKAYASHVSCERCHKPVNCTTCGIPLRLHRTSEDMLVCYHCAAYLRVPKQCPTCHGGRLKSAGLAGSQKIAEAINQLLDRHGHTKLAIPILDGDLVRTDSDESAIFETYDAMEHPMLVATQKIFSHRYARTFPSIVMIEADALVYNPDFRTQERLIYQCEKIADFRPTALYVQSWDRTGALEHVSTRAWDAFYRNELADRKALGWPPFVRIIKLTASHLHAVKASQAAQLAGDRLRRACEHLKVTKAVSILGPTPALVERAGGKWTHHIILKSSLAPEKLNELLAHVPPGIAIDVDPRSIT